MNFASELQSFCRHKSLTFKLARNIIDRIINFFRFAFKVQFSDALLMFCEMAFQRPVTTIQYVAAATEDENESENFDEVSELPDEGSEVSGEAPEVSEKASDEPEEASDEPEEAFDVPDEAPKITDEAQEIPEEAFKNSETTLPVQDTEAHVDPAESLFKDFNEWPSLADSCSKKANKHQRLGAV